MFVLDPKAPVDVAPVDVNGLAAACAKLVGSDDAKALKPPPLVPVPVPPPVVELPNPD